MKLKTIFKLIESDYRMSHRPSPPDAAAPLFDLTANDIYPDDVYSRKGKEYYGTGINDTETFAIILKYKDKPNATVTIYRAVPKAVNDINDGDWVAITKKYAKDHADGESDWHIISKKVKASEIYTNGDSWDEWGYWAK